MRIGWWAKERPPYNLLQGLVVLGASASGSSEGVGDLGFGVGEGEGGASGSLGGSLFPLFFNSSAFFLRDFISSSVGGLLSHLKI